MRSTHTNVSVERIGPMVAVAIGSASVSMTPSEAEEMIVAIKRAVDEARAPVVPTTIH